jgi:methylthioribose-1-phosphate isomerase
LLEPERILRLEPGHVVFLDQRQLPAEEVEVECRSAVEVADAIRTMVVRGAPAIGIAAAYGLALAAEQGEDLGAAEAVLRASRPTAVNLAWALDEMRADPSAEHARAIHRDEVDRCRAMAAHAAGLLSPGTRALTHCNAGGLATGGYGSAVGALLAAWERDVLTHVRLDTGTVSLGHSGTLRQARLTFFSDPPISQSQIVSLLIAGGSLDTVQNAPDSAQRNSAARNNMLLQGSAVLFQQFEEVRYPFGHASPIDALRDSMEARNLRQRDLIPVFGASSVVSDVINGKRSISKNHARKLAEFLHVPVSLFI